MWDLTHYLHLMAKQRASDCFFSAGAPPSIKIEGSTVHIGDVALSGEHVRTMAYSVLNDRQQKEFEATLEMNLALGLPDIGRFRINLYRQRGNVVGLMPHPEHCVEAGFGPSLDGLTFFSSILNSLAGAGTGLR